MSKYAIILFIISFLWIYLGLKSLLNDHKNKVNIFFSLLCLSMLIWTFFCGIIYSFNTSRFFPVFIKYAYIGGYFYFPLNLHFYLVLSKTRTKLWLLILYYLPAVILNAVNFMGISFIIDFIKYKGEWIAIFDSNNIWIYFYIFYILLTFFISFFIILKWGKNTKINKEKIYSRLILILLFFVHIGALILTLILPLYNIYNLQAIGVSLLSIYVIGLYFLVSKFRFMDLNYSLMADEIISNINDIVILLDLNLKVVDVNYKFEQVFSIPREKIKNKIFFDLIIENDDFKNKINEIVEKKRDNFNFRINYKKDDEYINTKTYISSISDKFKDLIGLFVISNEVKEIKQFQKYFKITNRELEIIELIISGSTYRDVSDKLSIAEKTVESHLTNIYNKLSVNNKIELIKIAGDFNIKPNLKD